jgi:hypothetical protein
MKMKSITLLALASFLIFTGFSPKSIQGKTTWIDGNWAGIKYQTNMSTGWQTILSMNSKAKKFTVSYPELNCGGELELESISKSKAVFIEKITRGKEVCVDNGYIIITKVNEKYISFTCLRDEKTRLASYATLEKE